MFVAVREKIAKKSQSSHLRTTGTSQRYGKNVNHLAGKVICAYCNHKMALSMSQNPVFCCIFTSAAPNEKCYELRVPHNELEQEVMKSIQSKLREIIRKTAKLGETVESNSGYSEQIGLLEESKCTIYEKLILGEINVDMFKEEKAVIDSEIARLKQAKTMHMKDSGRKPTYESIYKIAKASINKKRLTKQLVDSLIEKILIYKGIRIEIVWKLSELNIKEMEREKC
jgi:hypothetical protein